MAKIILNGIRLPVRHTEDDAREAACAYAKKHGVNIKNLVAHKKSLDARRKSDICFVYSFVADAENFSDSKICDKIKPFDESAGFDLLRLRSETAQNVKNKKILVVGSGPCGLFSAYVLSSCGADVTVVERGSCVEEREVKTETFFAGGKLDTECNIQFGEGGAGTFSDGKLNTGINSPYQKFVLNTFADCGAPPDIVYQAKPHIGTDFLKKCVVNLRKKIIENGGKVLFDTRLTDLCVKNGKIVGARLNGGDVLEYSDVILAIGHSSRDTYEMLNARGIIMEQKPFAVGVRIEHTREYINRLQYGNTPDLDALPTADYKLAYNGKTRSCYSFCMCPGGVVVNASSEEGGLVVNGMSMHDRMADNSNSALVVGVKPEDFEGASPLAGVEFQRKYERLAYSICKGRAPIQLAKDFVKGKESESLDGVFPSISGETEFADLRKCLPDFVAETLRDGLLFFDGRLKGYSSGGAVMTGVEMRTSAPLRILRNENGESISLGGLYPAGEGAGYAGGIMSAAIDGIHVAEKILNRNK